MKYLAYNSNCTKYIYEKQKRSILKCIRSHAIDFFYLVLNSEITVTFI